jgi:CRISPR-associated protein Csc1
MRLWHCTLVFHENLFYATREVGRLYETGSYLHNYALAYALGLAHAAYFHREQIPNYQAELEPLNERGIYVTPARGVSIRYELVTFKYADNAYRVKMAPGRRNTPSFGRAKEVAVGSVFEFGVLSDNPIELPRWVRMGLWQSKARLVAQAAAELKLVPSTERQASYPLNPLDVPGDLRVFDLISMPPSSLIDNGVVLGDWWHARTDQGEWWVPADMRYRFLPYEPSG